MTKAEILINPRMAWACPPSEQTRLKFVDGHGADWPTAPPPQGAVLTLPFIQDPATGLPVLVRVLHLQTHQESTGHVLVVVVARADQTH